jgi:hypothetical protein
MTGKDGKASVPEPRGLTGKRVAQVGDRNGRGLRGLELMMAGSQESTLCSLHDYTDPGPSF